jgi:hypothetical protein
MGDKIKRCIKCVHSQYDLDGKLHCMVKKENVNKKSKCTEESFFIEIK